MKSIQETKQHLKELQDYQRRLETVKKAADRLERYGIDRIDIEDRETYNIMEKVSQTVKEILQLPSEESEVLMARYLDGQPYEILNEHPYLQGMSKASSWRLLARAIEHYAEVI